MSDWNPITISNTTAGQLIGLILMLFSMVIILIILRKIVKISTGK